MKKIKCYVITDKMVKKIIDDCREVDSKGKRTRYKRGWDDALHLLMLEAIQMD